LREEKRELQYWHIRVALYHLRQVQPDILEGALAKAWGKLLGQLEIMITALPEKK
jgi:hypothetical protein